MNTLQKIVDEVLSDPNRHYFIADAPELVKSIIRSLAANVTPAMIMALRKQYTNGNYDNLHDLEESWTKNLQAAILESINEEVYDPLMTEGKYDDGRS